MLRYFYLICLLIYIKESFCYDHINDRDSKFRPLGKRFKRKKDSSSRNCDVKNAHVIRRRDEYENPNDNDQFAQIDVASFIQKPDFYADEELVSQQDDLNSQLIPKFNEYEILNNLDTSNTNPDENKKWKSNHNPALFKDMMDLNEDNLETSTANSKTSDLQYDLKNIFENEISEDNVVHNPLKKSPIHHLNNLKFPFFFHRRSNASKLTDINFTTSKQPYTMDFNDLVGYSSNDKSLPKDIQKRADKDNTCIKCKTSKGISKGDKRRIGTSLIHNSRQYYQKLKGDNKIKKVTKPKTENVNVNKDVVKSEIPVKPIVDSHKQEEKKTYIKRNKKEYMNKRKEKTTKKKKKLRQREYVESK